MFKYINNQTVPRDQFEIIWIEYYNRTAPEIEASLKECNLSGQPPILDQWIALDIPKNIYYHKHLMYNVGIVAAKGEIVVICDSDVMVQPTLTENIINAFNGNNPAAPKAEKGIVLHLDEVRNIDKAFYPFNYPSFEAILKKDCINWKNGKTTGLLDQNDRIHTLNYGACMCARREDLIAIGGADEHIDYLGHICGPYEMTFRLVNAGKTEIWHQEEFLYHTWHPGTDGKNNYCGPHDGRQVSSTALEGFHTGRILPLVENQAIKTLRLASRSHTREALIMEAIAGSNWEKWDFRKITKTAQSIPIKLFFFKILGKGFYAQVRRFLDKPKSMRDIFRGIFLSSFIFLRNSILSSSNLARKCEKSLDVFIATGVGEFAIFGIGNLAHIFYDLSAKKNIPIANVYDFRGGQSFHEFTVKPLEDLKYFQGKVVIGAIEDIEERVHQLKAIGVEIDRIVVLL